MEIGKLVWEYCNITHYNNVFVRMGGWSPPHDHDSECEHKHDHKLDHKGYHQRKHKHESLHNLILIQLDWYRISGNWIGSHLINFWNTLKNIFKLITNMKIELL